MGFQPFSTGDTATTDVASFLLPMRRLDWFKQNVLAALSQMAYENYWQPNGTITAEQAAELANEMIEGITVLDFNPLPPGRIDSFAGETIPEGWLLCDGTEYNQTDYPELFVAIAQLWGGSTGTFRVPDLSGKVQIGVNIDHDLAATGGEETHTLVTSEIPAHSHEATVTDAGHVHEEIAAVPIPILEGEIPFPGAAVPSPSVTGLGFTGISVSNSSTGGDGAHNNMQPFAVLNIIIYAGR